MALVQLTSKGLCCPSANLFVDPWKTVHTALITHAHSDHARPGHQLYIAVKECIPLLQIRLGRNIRYQAYDYGEQFTVNGVRISFHPAGHVPGSAQVRLEYKGEVCVVSGDYKLQADGISPEFEPVRCHTFITESTFGLPIFRWKPQQVVMNEINAWWAKNAAQQICSVIQAYSLGKAQRILQHLDHTIGDVYVHPAIAEMNHAIRVHFPALKWRKTLNESVSNADCRNSLVMLPFTGADSVWMKNLSPCLIASASGWNQISALRKRGGADESFILSDHADWDDLNTAIRECAAEEVFVTHGYTASFSRWLSSKGIKAAPLETLFGDPLDVTDKIEI